MSYFSNLVTVMKLVLLVVIMIAGFSIFDTTYLTPFIPPGKGINGIIQASCILFFNFIGFDFLTTLSPEAKNPVRDIPIAIELNVIICSVAYAVISFSLNGVGNIAAIGSGGGETAISEIF